MSQGECKHSRAREYLSGLVGVLAEDFTTQELAERVLWLARQLACCDRAALFVSDDKHLHLKASYPSGDSDFFLQLTNIHDNSPLWRCHAQSTPTLCKDRLTLALPINDRGVLYLNRSEPDPFTEPEITHLVALCQQAYFALELLHFRCRERSDEKLSGIVELMSELLTFNDPKDVLTRTGEYLEGWASSYFWALVAFGLESEPHYLMMGPRDQEIDRDAVLKLARLSAQKNRALSLMNVERLSFPKPTDHLGSMILSPMTGDQETIGCLMVGSRRAYFPRVERDLLSTLALQVGSHVWNLKLHRDLLSTHESLKSSQAQLIRSSKLAAVGQLAAGIAHEINTPLAAVNLAIESTLRSLHTAPEKASIRLERALQSSQQLGDIVSNLLRYSRNDPTCHRECDLNTLVESSLALVAHPLALKGVTIDVTLGSIPALHVNPSEIQQILINLINNASDAVQQSPIDKRTIAITTKPTTEGVELAVCDDGIGMDETTLSRLFEPFYTTKEVGEGTGLGLSVSRELSERNNARLSVTSVPNQGTTVSVLFVPSATGNQT